MERPDPSISLAFLAFLVTLAFLDPSISAQTSLYLAMERTELFSGG